MLTPESVADIAGLSMFALAKNKFQPVAGVQ